ncbi:MAG: hypothetical protein JXR63_00820 [Spirochaetales bacterium]|nr:hypothetical protein [Spirochaetales bacterium]
MKTNNFFDFFKKNYDIDQADVLYRVNALIIINMVGIFLFFATGLMNLISSFSSDLNYLLLGAAVADIFIGVILCVSLFFLQRGNFKISSNLMIFGAVLLGIALPAFRIENPAMLYNMTFFLYLMPAILALAFLGYSSYQALISWVIGIIIYACVLGFRIIPESLGGEVSLSAVLTKTIFDFIVFSVANLFAWQIIRTNNNIFNHLYSAEKNAENKMHKMSSLLFTVSEGLDNSRNLSTMSGKSLELSTKISNRLALMTQEMDNLNGQVEETRNIYATIEEKEKIVKDEMINQSAAVEQSSAAIEAMTESITVMTKIASEKQAIAIEINKAKESASEKMKQSTESVRNIKASAEKMLNVVKVITDIANKTNLLAMNASIEAAHAGDAGKGFSVVASEIRKLAEEATKNSKAIKEIIKSNEVEVDQTVGINQEVVDHFSSISMLISGINTAFSNISLGLSEINSGTSEIHRMVYNLRSLDVRVNESVDETLIKVLEGTKSIDAIAASSNEILNAIESISMDSLVIKDEADEIVSIGEKNIHLIQDLQSSLESSGVNLPTILN